MAWILSPTGIGVIVGIIFTIASLIYWRIEAIKKWFQPIIKWLRRQKMSDVEISVGPVKAKLGGQEKPKPASSSAGVSFGEGNDFTGATVRGVAGRDIRRGSATAAKAPGGKAPGVDFGKKGKFGHAEIEDVAGRDLVED